MNNTQIRFNLIVLSLLFLPIQCFCQSSRFNWEKAKPETEGVSSSTLNNATKYLDANFPYYRAMIIIRHDKEIYEKRNNKKVFSSSSDSIKAYISSYSNIRYTLLDSIGNLHNIRSCSKSIISLLIGIAIEKGYINSVNDPVSMYLPEYFTNCTDSIKKTITIKHLLTHKSGLINIDKHLDFINNKDWVNFILRAPLTSKPGEVFDYNTANTHILSAVITKVTHKNALEFAKDKLFNPLGIRNVKWQCDPVGNSFGGANLFMSVDDLAKIGYLILKDGNWHGKQIINKRWLNDSFKCYHHWIYDYNYGYLWYTKEYEDENNKKKYLVKEAAGTGGQRIYIIPQFDMVIAVVSDTDFSRDKSYFLNYMIGKYILPSVSDK